MRRQLLLLPLVLIGTLGCQPSGATSPPSIAPPSVEPTTTGGIDVLIADLGAGGATVEKGATFSSDPVGGEGTTVCVGEETIRTYEFIDHEAALAASQKIDPDDPTKIGNAVVSWMGKPRFWLRDRILVLYLGADEPTEAALLDLLGEPFAEGAEGFMPLPEPCP